MERLNARRFLAAGLVAGVAINVFDGTALHARDRRASRRDHGFFRGVTEPAIEIDLASVKNPGGQQRVVDYLEAGVRLVWTIDPRPLQLSPQSSTASRSTRRNSSALAVTSVRSRVRACAAMSTS